MTSIPERCRVIVIVAALAGAAGCGLDPPPEVAPFDCATIDRAAERFPDECGEPISEDAGAEDAEPQDAGIEDAASEDGP